MGENTRTKCNWCGALVRWVPSAKDPANKTYILDREPDPKGNIVIEGGVGVIRRPPKEESVLPGFEEPERFMPHQATCPPYIERRRREREAKERSKV